MDAIQLSYQKSICRDVQEICKPLFNLLNITLFGHIRAYHSGQFTSILTSTDLAEYYLRKKYPIYFSQGKGVTLNNGIYIGFPLHDVKAKLIRSELRDNFNTDHIIYLIEKGKEYDDVFTLGTTPHNDQIYHYYMNEIGLIYQFIYSYKEKARNLIKRATLVSYSNEHFPQGCDKKILCPYDMSTKHEFIKSLNTKKIAITGYYGEVYISKREYDCLKSLIKYHTIKEIAKYLNLSPRTVETYFLNLRNKLGCINKQQLISIAYDNKLL